MKLENLLSWSETYSTKLKNPLSQSYSTKLKKPISWSYSTKCKNPLSWSETYSTKVKKPSSWSYSTKPTPRTGFLVQIITCDCYNENHNIAIAMSSSRADPVLGLNILQG